MKSRVCMKGEDSMSSFMCSDECLHYTSNVDEVNISKMNKVEKLGLCLLSEISVKRLAEYYGIDHENAEEMISDIVDLIDKYTK